MEPSIQLEMNANQASIIIKALDLYSRLGIGQIDEIKTTMDVTFRRRDPLNNAEVDSHLTALKELYFPELRGKSYYGIFCGKAPEKSKIAWDLIQVIRYAMAWERSPSGGFTVDFGEPIKSSLKEDLAIAKIKR